MTAAILQYRNSLLQSPLGQHVGAAVCDDLMKYAEHLQIESGSTLFEIKDKPTGIYLLLDGRLKLIRCGPDNREHIVYLVEKNAVFGEAALFLKAHPTTAVAMQDCNLLLFPAHPFLKTMKSEADLQIYLLNVMAGWMHQLIEKIDQLTLCDGAQRLAGYLIGLVDDTPYAEFVMAVQVELPMRKKDLATMLNMNQPSLSRILRQFQDRGLISVKGRRIVLLDLVNLRAMSQLRVPGDPVIKRLDPLS